MSLSCNWYGQKNFNPLSVNLPTNCLSVFDRFMKLALKRLRVRKIEIENSDCEKLLRIKIYSRLTHETSN